jgi:hypothetical protein
MFKKWAGVCAVSTLLLTGGMIFGDDKQDPTPRSRGTLLPLWSKLGLTDEQKQQIYSIQGEFRGKIEDLRSQIHKLERDQRSQMEKVLTDAQRARLRELITEKFPGADKDKSNEDKK